MPDSIHNLLARCIPPDGVSARLCSDCHHSAHEPGQCAQDNCGQSEIVNTSPLARSFQAYDLMGRPISLGGLRVFPPIIQQ